MQNINSYCFNNYCIHLREIQILEPILFCWTDIRIKEKNEIDLRTHIFPRKIGLATILNGLIGYSPTLVRKKIFQYEKYWFWHFYEINTVVGKTHETPSQFQFSSDVIVVYRKHSTLKTTWLHTNSVCSLAGWWIRWTGPLGWN